MKTTKTFENATLRTVNNGYIELDYNGTTHCFNDASVISVNNGSISIEVDWKPKRGELIKAIGCGIDAYAIFESKGVHSITVFGSKDILSPWFKLSSHIWAISDALELHPVTPEEQQAFDDFCKSQGKIWNKEKLQWEKYKWKPTENTKYFHILIAGGTALVDHYLWKNDEVDRNYYELGNCFKTREEAEAKLEQIKKLLLKV